MLRTLRIRHLAVIEDLTISFGAGLNVLTGETGAGKSIVVDAVGLAAGDRAESHRIRTGEDRAVVEAVFELPPDSPAATLLAERGMNPAEGGQFAVRREVRPSGASGRVFVNGSPVTVAQLREIGDLLVELHGQHEHQTLLSAERHLELLDAFAGAEGLADRVRQAFAAVAESRQRLAELRELAERRSRRAAELAEVVRDVDRTRPVPGEVNRLERERRVLQNAGRIAALLDEAIGLLQDGEPAAASLAAAGARRARELAGFDPSLAGVAEAIEGARIELEEAASSLRGYRSRTAFDPERLEAVESRRAELSRLLLRYGPDEEDALRARDEAAAELAALEGLEASVEQARRRISEAEARYADAARSLSAARAEAARRMSGAVQEQLGALALEGARFEVGFAPAYGERLGTNGLALSARGAERAEFLLAANPGESARPLAKVASGGELARVMLAIHLVSEGAARGKVLVFDEVDAGVGAVAAGAVGLRLARLARRCQVLLVTHLPQVAAHADRHYHVRKTVAGGRTRVSVVELEEEERVEELARMLGGRAVTAASRRHAAELLSAAAGATGAGARRRA